MATFTNQAKNIVGLAFLATHDSKYIVTHDSEKIFVSDGWRNQGENSASYDNVRITGVGSWGDTLVKWGDELFTWGAEKNTFTNQPKA